MISVYNLKPAFQKLLRPLLVRLHNIGVSPNLLTLKAIFLSIGIALIIAYKVGGTYSVLALPVGLLIRMALNALDGMMAREYQLQSKSGEVLNELGDVFSDSVITCSLFVLGIIDAHVLLLFLILSVLNEFAGVLMKAVNGIRRYDGPMGKSDRALLLGLTGILLFFEILPIETYTYIYLTASALVILSTVLRIRNGLKNG